MDCSPTGFSVDGISQARWIAISFCRGSSQPRDWTCVSCIGRWILYHWGTRKHKKHQFSSVQFSHSVVSDSLRPHELQHARPPCPSPTLGVYSNSCPSSRWCHPAISSPVIPFSSCPQSLPASGSFPMSQLFIWGGQSIGVSASASASVLPMKHRWWYNAHSTSWSPGLRAQTQLKFPWNPIIFLHPPEFLSFYDTNIALKILVFWASLFSNMIFDLFQVSDGFI